MIMERNPQAGKAVVKLRRLSADEEACDMYERREKSRRDEESLLRWARIEGRQEERQKWQTVVADKDAEIARLREQLKNHP